jgi:hypothetical protein
MEVKISDVLHPVIGQRNPRSIPEWHFAVSR